MLIGLLVSSQFYAARQEKAVLHQKTRRDVLLVAESRDCQPTWRRGTELKCHHPVSWHVAANNITATVCVRLCIRNVSLHYAVSRHDSVYDKIRNHSQQISQFTFLKLWDARKFSCETRWQKSHWNV